MGIRIEWTCDAEGCNEFKYPAMYRHPKPDCPVPATTWVQTLHVHGATRPPEGWRRYGMLVLCPKHSGANA
jgi:hypothetical protein